MYKLMRWEADGWHSVAVGLTLEQAVSAKTLNEMTGDKCLIKLASESVVTAEELQMSRIEHYLDNEANR